MCIYFHIGVHTRIDFLGPLHVLKIWYFMLQYISILEHKKSSWSFFLWTDKKTTNLDGGCTICEEKAPMEMLKSELIGDLHLATSSLYRQGNWGWSSCHNDWAATTVIYNTFRSKAVSLTHSPRPQLYHSLPPIKKRSPVNHACVSSDVSELRQEAKARIVCSVSFRRWLRHQPSGHLPQVIIYKGSKSPL